MKPEHNRFRLAPVLALLFLTGCGDKPSQPAAAAPPAVTIAQPVKRTVTDWDEFTGRFEAIEEVVIRIAQMREYTIDLALRIYVSDQQWIKNSLEILPIDLSDRMAMATILLDSHRQGGASEVKDNVRFRADDRRIERHLEVLSHNVVDCNESLVNLY